MELSRIQDKVREHEECQSQSHPGSASKRPASTPLEGNPKRQASTLSRATPSTIIDLGDSDSEPETPPIGSDLQGNWTVGSIQQGKHTVGSVGQSRSTVGSIPQASSTVGSIQQASSTLGGAQPLIAVRGSISPESNTRIALTGELLARVTQMIGTNSAGEQFPSVTRRARLLNLLYSSPILHMS